VGGEALGQPALHAAGGDRDHLGGEWVGRRVRGEDPGQGIGEAVGAFGSVQVEHVLSWMKSPGAVVT
jgi:hypothetical protein